ncbi:MAG: hypothetical protein R3E84_20640 [Pseudomonadales bacterium]
MIAALVFLWPSVPAVAGEGGPCDGAAFRQFDFWLGHWAVTVKNGRPAGQNTIVSDQQGCLLMEHWQGVGGATGRSVNFYDPERQRWRQVWVAPGTVIDIEGGLEASGMRLTGTIVYVPAGNRRPFRGLWTPLADGRVRQYFEEQGEDGAWQSWFEGFYTPAEAESAGG